jgi:hypothetical protein
MAARPWDNHGVDPSARGFEELGRRADLTRLTLSAGLI